MSRSLFFLFLILAVTLIPMAAAAAIRGTVVVAADSMAEAIDGQILEHFNIEQPGIFAADKEKNRAVGVRRALTISCTSAVDLNDLETSSTIGRQISEEMARWFVQAGYKVQDIRKGRDVYFDARGGERVLTRDVRKLFSPGVRTEAVLAGTYVVTPEQVRFTMRLLHAPSNEILAMATATVSITPDIKRLVRDEGDTRVRPSIGTKLK